MFPVPAGLAAGLVPVLAGPVAAARWGLNAYRGVLYACSLCAIAVGGFWLVT